MKKEQEKLIDVPELCQFCKYKSKDENPDSDWNFDHCSFLEGDFKPNILCFAPKNNKAYTRLNEVAVDFMNKLDELRRELEKEFYKDIRNIFIYSDRIASLIKDLKEQYHRAFSDFLHYLTQNNLTFYDKYLFPA